LRSFVGLVIVRGVNASLGTGKDCIQQIVRLGEKQLTASGAMQAAGIRLAA